MTSYEYTGGAHGMTVRSHTILDLQAQRELKLNDLLAEGKLPDLTKLVRDEYNDNARLLNEDADAAKVDEYYKMWPFTMTENVYFSDRGLVFFYQPYDIAWYAAGPQELTVPYAQLNGILKPQYLPQAK